MVYGPTPTDPREIEDCISSIVDSISHSVRDIASSVSEPRVHELKCWPEFFQAILAGIKMFEYRKDDRGYQVGDTLHLREWKPQACEYTGREMKLFIPYMIRLNDVENHVVMSIKVL